MTSISIEINEDGSVKCYIDIPMLNNTTDFGGRFPSNKLENLVQCFHVQFGLDSFALPECTRIGFRRLINTPANVDHAKSILTIFLTISTLSKNIPQVAESAPRKEFDSSKTKTGECYASGRKMQDQNYVLSAFERLKINGANPIEIGENKFVVYGLKRGLFKSNYLYINSIQELVELSNNYGGK